MYLVHKRCQEMKTTSYDLGLKAGFAIQGNDLHIQGTLMRPPFFDDGDLVIGDDSKTYDPQ